MTSGFGFLLLLALAGVRSLVLPTTTPARRCVAETWGLCFRPSTSFPDSAPTRTWRFRSATPAGPSPSASSARGSCWIRWASAAARRALRKRDWKYVAWVSIGWAANYLMFAFMLIIFVIYGCRFQAIYAEGVPGEGHSTEGGSGIGCGMPRCFVLGRSTRNAT